MSYRLELDTQDKLVKVDVDGFLDNNIRKDILSEIVSHLKATKYSKAIIDLRRAIFNLAEPLDGSVKLTMHMSDIGMSPDAKLAFVYEKAETHRKAFEKIAQKIGYQLQYFKNVDEAYNWLRTS